MIDLGLGLKKIYGCIAILNDSDKLVGVVLRVPTPYLSGNRAWDYPYNNYANDLGLLYSENKNFGC